MDHAHFGSSALTPRYRLIVEAVATKGRLRGTEVRAPEGTGRAGPWGVGRAPMSLAKLVWITMSA